MQIDEIKRLIADTPLKRDVTAVRAAWIAYGGLLAQCPFKGGRQIGEWVRAEGLDFVEDRRERTASLTLFNTTDGNSRQLDGCPYSRPTDVLKWLRAQDADDTEPGKPAADDTDAGVTPTPTTPAGRFNAAITELRNAFRALPGDYIAQHYSTPMEGTHASKLCKPLADAAVTWADSVTLPAVVAGAVLDIRVYVAEFDVTSPDDVSGFVVVERD